MRNIHQLVRKKMLWKEQKIEETISYLKALKEGGEQKSSPIHVHDMLNQLMDRYITEHQLWNDNRSLRNGSWSSKGRAVRDSGRRDLYKRMQKYEKSYKKVRFQRGSQEDYQVFFEYCMLLVQDFAFQGQLVRSFLPESVQVVNAVSVDTSRGYKMIQLCHANAVDVQSDIVVLSANNAVDTTPSGFLLQRDEKARDRQVQAAAG